MTRCRRRDWGGGGHRLQGADDLELAGGLAREVEGAVEVSGAELVEGELEENAGLAEAGRSLEEDEGLALEERGEFGAGGFLAGARGRKGRAEAQVAQALAGAEAQIEELGDTFELGAEEALIGRRERHRLHEARASLDENEFRRRGPAENVTHWVTFCLRLRFAGGVCRGSGRLRDVTHWVALCGGGGGKAEAGEGGVGGELDEVRGVVGAERGLVGGERAGDGLDFAEQRAVGMAHH